MKQLTIRRLILGVAAFMLLAAGIVGTLYGLRARDNTPSADQATSARQAQQSDSDSSGQASNDDSSPAASHGDTASTNASRDDDNACAILSAATAQRLLGTDAKSTQPPSTAEYETADTTVSACAYGNASGSIQIVVRASQNKLGVSKNALVFGSGRPAGVAAVEGYGQSAYWDSAAKRLNVLKDNDWYAITTASGTQADAEAVAKEAFKAL